MVVGLRYRLEHAKVVDNDDDDSDDAAAVATRSNNVRQKQMLLPPYQSSRLYIIVAVVVGCCCCVFLGLHNNKVGDDRTYYDNDSTTNNSNSSICRRRPTSVAAMRRCFPQRMAWLDQERPLCHNLTTWEQLQQCLQPQQQPVATTTTSQQQTYEIHILGERHSGTKFLTRVLQQCFPHHATTSTNVRVHRDLIRSKHFFQPLQDEQGILSSSSTTHSHHHMVVIVVRDVLAWMAAMVEKPYHAPDHVQALTDTTITPLPWREFVQRPWTMTNSHNNNNTHPTRPSSLDHHFPCQQGFAVDEVVPCYPPTTTGSTTTTIMPQQLLQLPPSRRRGFTPVYELAPDGRPYRNLLDLRADKLFHFVWHVPFLLLPNTTSAAVWIVRYETLVGEGTGPLVAALAAHMHNNSNHTTCTPPGPQPERFQQQQRPLEKDPAFRKWVAQHVHTDMEQLMGYNVDWILSDMQ